MRNHFMENTRQLLIMHMEQFARAAMNCRTVLAQLQEAEYGR